MPSLVSISYGMVQVSGKNSGMTLQELLYLADKRMYHHKRLNKKERHLSS